MVAVAACTFKDGAITVAPTTSAMGAPPGATAATSHGLGSQAGPPPDAGVGTWPGAVELDATSWIELDVPVGLPVGPVVVDLVLRPGVPSDHAIAGAALDEPARLAGHDRIIGGGPIRVAGVSSGGGLAVVAEVATRDGPVLLATRGYALGLLGWQRLTIALTGVEVVLFVQDRFVDRHVLAAPASLVPATTIALGVPIEEDDVPTGMPSGQGGDHARPRTLPMTVAAFEVHDDLPRDLQQVLDDARARGEGELSSLASRHPDLVAGLDLQDQPVRASRHRHYPDAEFVWHPATGAHVLTGPIRTLWVEQESQAGQLGYPLTDTVPAADLFAPWTRGAAPRPPLARTPTAPPGTAAQFEGGVVVDVEGDAIPVTGQVLVRWRAHAGAAGFLGHPLGPERDAGPDATAGPNGANPTSPPPSTGPGSHGLRQDFQGGTIFWHRDTDAHALFGAMLEAYEDRGGPAVVGHPVTEQVARDDEPGLSLVTTRGVLRLPDGTPPGHLVSADLHRTWEAARADLGDIRGDEVRRPSGVRVVACDRGVVVAVPGTPPRALTSLEVVLHEAMVPEADDGIALLGWDDSAELRVESTVEVRHEGPAPDGPAPHGPTKDGSPPDGPTKDGPPPDGSDLDVRGAPSRPTDDDRRVELAVAPLLVRRVRPDTTIRIAFTAWDRDTLSADDRLGGLDLTFDVDTMWGLVGQGGGAHELRGEGGDGTVVYGFRIAPPGIDVTEVAPADFREHLWWRFDNFETRELDRPLFAETFEDVEAEPDVALADLVAEAFYHAIYKGSARTGNCYGLSLEALRTHLGIGLWSAPLDDVGPAGGGLVDGAQLEQWMERRFNRAQGSQLSAAMTFHLLRSMANGAILWPGRVFDEVAARTRAGEVVILSMFDLRGGAGHAVLAYDTHADVGAGGLRTIFVADPNTPWGPAVTDRAGAGPFDWRDRGASRIEIRPDGGWTFRHRGGVPHEGFTTDGPLPSATLLAIPASVALAPARTPLGDVASHLAWLTGGLLVLNGGGTTGMSMGSSPPSAFASHVETLWGLRDFTGSEVGTGDGWLSPARMAEVWGDRLAATPGLLRLPVFDGGPGEVYARVGRFPDQLRHEVTADGSDELTWMLATGTHGIAARGALPADDALAMDVHGLEAATPRLTMAGSGIRTDVEVGWAARTPGTAARPAASTVLPVGREITSHLEVLDGGRRLAILPGATMPDLQVQLGAAAGTTPPSLVRVGPTEAGVRVDLRPADPVSPLGSQVVARRALDGTLVQQEVVAPTA
jgi:hypothetical protein